MDKAGETSEISRRIHILHVISRLPVGGVENMLLKVVQGYDSSRFRASICCIREGGAVADELQRRGFKVIVLNRMQGHGFDAGAVKALFQVIKGENIHILRTHQYHANLYGRIAGLLAGVSIIVPSFHNLYRSPAPPKLHRRAINHLLSYFSDRLVAVSDAVRSDMIAYDRVDPAKVMVIHNGVEVEKYQTALSREEARKALRMPGKTVVIGAAGRLTVQKGHALLIEAAAGIENITIAVAGDGPLMHELQNLCEGCHVRCSLLGRIEPDMMPQFFRSLDIFCFPSLWEGMPSALVEAMAAGLPVIASDILPHREVVGDAGMLVPPADAPALRTAIMALLENGSLRNDLAGKAKERAVEFDLMKTVKSYETLFEQLMKTKGLS
ncbi:MAG: glycosyltransferase [Nitrospirota bacterium]|nr:glycosyltransferase [Nitrospirota bacterium]